jgi:two-component system NtrC family response regulator
VHHFVDRSSARAIDRRALAFLMDYDWPGNVRELQNAIERAAIICQDIITLPDLPANIRLENKTAEGFEIPEEGFQLEAFEKELILQALQKAGSNKTRAAELLGITRRRLYSMMERFGIELNS